MDFPHGVSNEDPGCNSMSALRTALYISTISVSPMGPARHSSIILMAPLLTGLVTSSRRRCAPPISRHPHETIDGWTSRDHRLENLDRYRTTKHAGQPTFYPHRELLTWSSSPGTIELSTISSGHCRTRTALTVPRFATQPPVMRIYALSREIVALHQPGVDPLLEEVRASTAFFLAFEVFQSRLWDPRILARHSHEGTCSSNTRRDRQMNRQAVATGSPRAQLASLAVLIRTTGFVDVHSMRP